MITKKIKMVPFVAVMFALVAMSFNLVSLHSSQAPWYAVGAYDDELEGHPILGVLPGPPDGPDCTVGPQLEFMCAVQHDDDPNTPTVEDISGGPISTAWSDDEP